MKEAEEVNENQFSAGIRKDGNYKKIDPMKKNVEKGEQTFLFLSVFFFIIVCHFSTIYSH